MDLETIKVWKKLINNSLVKKKLIPEFFSELMALPMLFGGKEWDLKNIQEMMIETNQEVNKIIRHGL